MIRVLVIDDEPGLRSFLAKALSRAGFDVDTAANGEEGLQLAQQQGYQVVVTDLKMPKVDGLQVLETLKTTQPEVEVILLTAHGDVPTAVDAMQKGAFDFLQKPISSPAALRTLVERAAERRQLLDSVELERPDGLPPLTWGDPVMAPVIRVLQRVAPTDATVLIQGETGTGKEVAARTLHGWSNRSGGPFVAVNCAMLSENLLESELFGHERGAFTGAVGRKRGKVELAQGGTFFLDEVGELSPELQARLLRVLQENTFERVGGQQTLSANVRWVAATNRDLLAQVRDGSFREDLYHRLAVMPVSLPPLRARQVDLLPLARHLLHHLAADIGRSGMRLSQAAEMTLVRNPWRGNVRALRNALERAVILAEGNQIEPHDLLLPELSAPSVAAAAPVSMEEAEKSAIKAALRHTDGNRKQSAELLGIGLRTLYDKLKKYDLG